MDDMASGALQRCLTRWLENRQRAVGEDLASRSAEITKEAKELRKVVAERWLVYPPAA
jgi:hypothetical protein